MAGFTLGFRSPRKTTMKVVAAQADQEEGTSTLGKMPLSLSPNKSHIIKTACAAVVTSSAPKVLKKNRLSALVTFSASLVPFSTSSSRKDSSQKNKAHRSPSLLSHNIKYYYQVIQEEEEEEEETRESANTEPLNFGHAHDSSSSSVPDLQSMDASGSDEEKSAIDNTTTTTTSILTPSETDQSQVHGSPNKRPWLVDLDSERPPEMQSSSVSLPDNKSPGRFCLPEITAEYSPKDNEMPSTCLASSNSLCGYLTSDHDKGQEDLSPSALITEPSLVAVPFHTFFALDPSKHSRTSLESANMMTLKILSSRDQQSMQTDGYPSFYGEEYEDQMVLAIVPSSSLSGSKSMQTNDYPSFYAEEYQDEMVLTIVPSVSLSGSGRLGIEPVARHFPNEQTFPIPLPTPIIAKPTGPFVCNLAYFFSQEEDTTPVTFIAIPLLCDRSIISEITSDYAMMGDTATTIEIVQDCQQRHTMFVLQGINKRALGPNVKKLVSIYENLSSSAKAQNEAHVISIRSK